jgi:hypothetical protein
MDELREQLHQLVDKLPDQTLEHARTALVYCGDPEKHRLNIENAKQRAKENSERHLRKHAERTGHGFVSGIGSGVGQSFPDGNHHSSMIAFEDGKDATYHLYVYRGTMFEIIETIEFSEDGQRLIRRFWGPPNKAGVMPAERRTFCSIERRSQVCKSGSQQEKR